MPRKPKPAPERHKTLDVVADSAHQIWLAGLGAFAKAQEEGTKVFDALVKEGESIRAQMGRLKSTQIDHLGQAAAGAWHRVEHALDAGVSKSLTRMGIPTRAELQALSRELGRLGKRVDELLAAGASGKRGAVRRPAAPSSKPAARARASAKAAVSPKTPRAASRGARKPVKRSGA